MRTRHNAVLYTQCLSSFTINYYHPITGSYIAAINARIIQQKTKTRSTTKPQVCTTLYSDHKNPKMTQNSLSFNHTVRLSNVIKAYHKMPPVQ